MGRRRGGKKHKKQDKGNIREEREDTPSDNETNEPVSGSSYEDQNSPRAPQRVESLDYQQPSTSATPDAGPRESNKPPDPIFDRMMEQLELVQKAVQYQNRREGQNRRNKNRRDDRSTRQARGRGNHGLSHQQQQENRRGMAENIRVYMPQPPAKDYPTNLCPCKECQSGWTRVGEKSEDCTTSRKQQKNGTDETRNDPEASTSPLGQDPTGRQSQAKPETPSYHLPPNYDKLPQPPFPRTVIRSPIHPHAPGGMATTFEEQMAQRGGPNAGRRIHTTPRHRLPHSTDTDSDRSSPPERVPDPEKHVCNLSPQKAQSSKEDPVRAYVEDIVAVEYRKAMTTVEYLVKLKKTESITQAKINDPNCPPLVRTACRVTHTCIVDKIKQNRKLVCYVDSIKILLKKVGKVQDLSQQKKFIEGIINALDKTCIASDDLGNGLLALLKDFEQILKQGKDLNTPEVIKVVQQIRISVLLINREPKTFPEEFLDEVKVIEKSTNRSGPKPFFGDSCVRPKTRTVTNRTQASTFFGANSPKNETDTDPSEESSSDSNVKASPVKEKEDTLTIDSLIGFVQTCQRLESTISLESASQITSSAETTVESDFKECSDSDKSQQQDEPVSPKTPLGAEASRESFTENSIGMEELCLKYPPSEFRRPCYQLFGRFGPWKKKRDQLNPAHQFCKNCKEPFRWPHLLACFHVFCFPCIVKMYVEEKDCVQCALCSRPSPITDAGPDSLDIDIGKCRLMLLVDKCPFACTCCTMKSFASVYCRTCMAYLCRDSEMAHRKSEELKTHDFHTVIKVAMDEEGKPCATCLHHPGMILEKVCKPCWSPMCLHCEYTTHKGHEISSFDQVASECNNRIKKYSSFYSMFREEIQSNLQYLNLQKQTVDTAFKDKRSEVNRYHSALSRWIDLSTRKATGMLNQASTAIHNKISKDAEDLMAYQEELRAFSDFTDRTMELGRQGHYEEFMSLIGTITQRWNELNKKREELDITDSLDIQFEPSFPEINRVLEESFESLQIHVNTNYENLHKLSRGQERVDIEPIQPLPYGLDRLFGAEARSSDESPSGASACTDADQQEAQLSFIRATIPYSRAFGQYGRGCYEFAEPSGVLYLRDGRLAVCDSRNHRIVIYNADGTFCDIYGMPSNLPPLSDANSQDNIDRPFQRTFSKLYFPFRIAECPSTGCIVVLERPPSLDIQVFSREGFFLRSFGNSHLRYPRGITVDDNGLVLVVESRTMNFFIFTIQGDKIQSNYLSLHLEFPNDIVAKNRRIYISDNRTHCVHIFNYSLERVGSIGNESLTYFPIGVSFNHLNQIVITDNHNTFNISVFEPDGTFVYGVKSRSKHANCYNVALHPTRAELAVTTRECKVLIFNYEQPEGQTSSVNDMPM